MRQDKSRRLREAALGWLEIEIYGEHTEHLLNLALQAGIELHHIRRYGQHRLCARLLLSELYELRPLLAKARCGFRVRKRAGRPFLARRALGRAGLILGGLCFAAALFWLCSCIWRIRVESIYPLSAAEHQRILEIGREVGLKEGQSSLGLDLSHLSRQIQKEAGDLIFANIERRGITAIIHVVRRVDIEADSPLPPGDILAASDGMIESILVKSGRAAVAAGDTVKAGDVLVYGLNSSEPTAAAALIEARLWGEASADWPLSEKGLRPSGQSSGNLLLRFGLGEAGRELLLSGPQNAPYQHFSREQQLIRPALWRNIMLPVELIANSWYEQEPYATSYSREQALYHARERAAGLALEKLPAQCDLLSQKALELESDDSGLVRVQVIYEARADIGYFLPLSAQRKQAYEDFIREEQLAH